MKKLLALALLVLFVSTLAIPVFAAQSASISVAASADTVARGQTFTVTVSTTQVDNCTSGGFMFQYDSNVFEYVGGSALVNGFSMSGITDMAGSLSGYFMNTSGGSIIINQLFRVSFKVKDDAPDGSYTFSGTPNLVVLNGASKENVSCSVSSATVNVACKHSYGSCIKQDDTYHSRQCVDCGYVQKEAHTWGKGTIVKQASCKEDGQIDYTCSGCFTTKSETVEKLTTHTYDHDCDTDCNVCGATRTTTHKYMTAWSSDPANHWHECASCGNWKDVAAHTPGAAATENTPQTCTACGYTIAAALGHNHSYASKWTTDDKGHWYACSGCNEKGSYADHSFENACDPDCAVCGYTRKTTHAFDEKWITDKTNHWHACTGCGLKQDEAAHNPGAEATATTAQTCTACGYEIAPALDQSTTPTEDTADPDVPGEDSSGFPWWIIIVSAVAIGGIVAVVIKKKR